MSKKKDKGLWTITYVMTQAEHEQYMREKKFFDEWLKWLNREDNKKVLKS